MLFGIVVFVVGLTVAGLFYARMKSAIIANNAQLFDETAALVAQQIDLNRSGIDVGLNVAARTALAIEPTFEARLTHADVLSTILKNNPLIESAYVGYPNGEFFLLRGHATSEEKAPSGTAYVVRASSQTQPGRMVFLDSALRRIETRILPDYHFDPRTRPWFNVPADHLNVTDPYVFFSTGELGLTLSVRAPSGSVFGADVLLGSLSQRLAKTLPTRSSMSALVDANGQVLAFSQPSAFFALTGAHGSRVLLQTLKTPQLLAGYAAAIQSQMRADGSYRDAKGRIWRYRASPIATARGQGVLLIAIPEDELTEAADQVRRDALLAGLAILLAAIPITVWIATLVARSLRRLRSDAVALRSFDFSDRPKLNSAITEIVEFSDTFDAMRRHMRDYNAASTRFVPQQFMELLGREDLQGLKLGDHIERDMTVLFSDIRSFTTLSGKMTPQQTFNFVNSYLTRIGPIIREHHGFIDKYIGDAIMALFPHTPANAIETAIAMQRRVVTYNQERARAGYDPVAIGIGMHRGKLMLGTIGEAERFETTVISDVVNIASRLESLTKTFHVLILASGDVVDDLEKGSCVSRRLCDVQVKGATHPITLYEICDADLPDLVEHKVQTMEEFAIGRIAYAQGHFADAFRAFEDIAEREPRDLVAAYFRDRAWELSRTTDLTWDGIERMETK